MSNVPRKCSATGKLIRPDDHASVQISFVKVNENGVATNEVEYISISGDLRRSSRSDAAVNLLVKQKNIAQIDL